MNEINKLEKTQHLQTVMILSAQFASLFVFV